MRSNCERSLGFAKACGFIAACLGGLLTVFPGVAQSTPVGPTAEVAQPAGPSSTAGSPADAAVPHKVESAGTQPAQPTIAADYILGQGDRLSVRVFGADDLLDRPLDVSAEGDILAPLVGQVKAAGLSVQGLEAELTEQYKKYYKDPEVTVTVLEYRSQPVTVVGSVNTPGVIQLRRPARLMEVISQAGGLRADAGDKALITRRDAAGSTAANGSRGFVTQEVELHKIIEGNDPSLNIIVRGNDLITIPKAKMVYVVGAIGRPGGYVLDGHSSTITVLQAIALAGGVNSTARASQSRILRASGDDSHRTETVVNLKKILANNAPDVELHAEDILFVPNSVAKNAGVRSLEMAANIGTGLAIWRF